MKGPRISSPPGVLRSQGAAVTPRGSDFDKRGRQPLLGVFLKSTSSDSSFHARLERAHRSNGREVLCPPRLQSLAPQLLEAPEQAFRSGRTCDHDSQPGAGKSPALGLAFQSVDDTEPNGGHSLRSTSRVQRPILFLFLGPQIRQHQPLPFMTAA